MILTRRLVISDAFSVCPISRLRLELDTDLHYRARTRGPSGSFGLTSIPSSNQNPTDSIAGLPSRPGAARYLAEHTVAEADWARGGTAARVVAPTRSQAVCHPTSWRRRTRYRRRSDEPQQKTRIHRKEYVYKWNTSSSENSWLWNAAR